MYPGELVWIPRDQPLYLDVQTLKDPMRSDYANYGVTAPKKKIAHCPGDMDGRIAVLIERVAWEHTEKYDYGAGQKHEYKYIKYGWLVATPFGHGYVPESSIRIWRRHDGGRHEEPTVPIINRPKKPKGFGAKPRRWKPAPGAAPKKLV